MKLLLDLDGSLLDCRQRLHRLFCDLTGCTTLSLEKYWKLKREPRSHDWILENLLGYDPERVRRFKGRWLDLIEEDPYLGLDQPAAGAQEALALLRQKASLYILTARQNSEAASAQLKTLGLDQYIDGVIVTGGKHSKADSVRAASLALERGDALVGDTGEDIAAARDLGVEAVALTGGFRSAEYLAGCGADFIYNDILDFARSHFGARQSAASHPRKKDVDA